ncbi:MAG TPA: MASE1 domain-containing protein [Myxococcota bacterium]|nr:MASE1 domain-containing protein [Myxococcota bacterium]
MASFARRLVPEVSRRLAIALPPPDRTSGVLARATVLGLAYFAAAHVAMRLASDFAYQVPVWPPGGIAVAALLLLGLRYAIVLVVASVVAGLSLGLPFGVATAVAVAKTVAAMVPVVVLERVPGFSPALRRTRDVAIFSLVAAVLAPALAIAASIGVEVWAGLTPASGALALGFGWWAGAGIGMLAFAPAILAFARPSSVPAPARGLLECLALAAAFLLVSAVPFAVGVERTFALVLYAAVLVPPVLWAAIRHDRRALGLVNVGLAAVSAVLLWFARPFLPQDLFREHAVILQIFVGVVIAMGLVVSAAVGEWRGADAEHRASEERFRAAVEGGLDAFGLLRAVREPGGDVVDFAIVELNSRATRLLSTLGPSPIGRRLTELLPNLTSGLFFARAVECFERGVAREDEYRASGAVLPTSFPAECMRCLIVPLSEGVAVTVRDITEAKRLESQLAQAVKLEAVGRLAGGVAHDFNNLLTAISGYGEVALSQLPPGSTVRDDVQEMLRAGERAAALTRQLLAVSRRQVLQREPLDLNGVVRETTALLGRILGADVRLVTSLHDSLPIVLADAGQMQQVIMNLALNARDALPRGGEVAIGTSPMALDEVAARRLVGASPGSYAVLEVRDDGVGMDEETRQRVFEPFFTTKPADKGTGLGLSIVYGIVQQCGGHISVESAPGRGARVRILLPAYDGALERTGADDARAGARAPRRTVLVAEDEPPLRKLLERVLVASGYRVLAAADGEEALALCRAHDGSVDLLVTDLVMPRLGGRALAREARALHPGLAVLYVSGYDAEGSRGALGVDDAELLAKPFTPERLLARVKQALEDDSRPERPPRA